MKAEGALITFTVVLFTGIKITLFITFCLLITKCILGGTP